MRILITGSAGFVGRYLVAALCALPNRPEIILGTHCNALTQHHDIKAVALDVTDRQLVQTVIVSEQPTHIFHLAAIAAVSHRNLAETWAVNLGGSLNIVDAIMEKAPACRLLCCTSAEIYGSSFESGLPLDEWAQIDPVNPYGASKAAADILVGQMAKQGLKAIRLRPFNHIGPGQSESFVVPAFAAQIARIERELQPPTIRVGNLAVQRDFLDVRDVVDAYVQALVNFDQLPNGCSLNVASGRAISIREILDRLRSFSTSNFDVIVDPARFRTSECAVTVGDAGRARRLLHWHPRIDINDTLKAILDWHRAVISAK